LQKGYPKVEEEEESDRNRDDEEEKLRPLVVRDVIYYTVILWFECIFLRIYIYSSPRF
jgi:hypothetical protein